MSMAFSWSHRVIFGCLIAATWVLAEDESLSQQDPVAAKQLADDEENTNVVASVGTTVTLMCKDVHDVFDIISWWRNDSLNYIATKQLSNTQYAEPYQNRALFDGRNLQIGDIRLSDDSHYWCQTTYLGNTLAAKAIHLSVQESPSCLGIQSTVSAINGSSTLLPCEARGNPKPSVEWRKIGSALPPGRFSVTDRGLAIQKVEIHDSGNYQVTLTSAAGQFARVVVLDVKTAGSVLPQNSIDTVQGETSYLPCGRDPIDSTATILWTKDGTSVTDGNRERFSVYSGSTLRIVRTDKADGGLYQCSARSLTPSGAAVTVAHNIYLNVQYAPEIINSESVVKAIVGHDAEVPCSAVGNPAVTYRWRSMSYGELQTSDKYELSANGSLHIRNVQISDEQNYTCAPYNKIGAGQVADTYLTVLVQPSFVSTVAYEQRVKLGDEISLNCVTKGKPRANVTWSRRSGEMDISRVRYHPSGLATILRAEISDHGAYACYVKSEAGTLGRDFMLVVISLPDRPTGLSVTTIDSVAQVQWQHAYDGGSPQSFQVWYRLLNESDFNWVVHPSTNFTSVSIALNGLTESGGPEMAYYFGVRAHNMLGFGMFSDVVKVQRSKFRGVSHTGVSQGKYISESPPSPRNLLVNVSRAGYLLSWQSLAVPGRPQHDQFWFEARVKNSTDAWVKLAKVVPASESGVLYASSEVEADKRDKVLEFRMFAVAGDKPSDPTVPYKVVITDLPGVPTVLPMKPREAGDRDLVPAIVLGVIFGLFVIVLLLSLYCFCRHKRKKKYHASKNERKVEYKKASSDGDSNWNGTDEGLTVSDTVPLGKFKNDSPRRFHLPNCPALKLGRHTQAMTELAGDDRLALLSDEARQHGVHALLEPNKDEKLLCTCGKNYLTLQVNGKKKQGLKKKGMYKSSSEPSVLTLSEDMASVSIDPSDLLDEEEYDISDVEKDVLGEMVKKQASLNRVPFKDSFDQFCKGPEQRGSRKALAAVRDYPENKLSDRQSKNREDGIDASSENSATESERPVTPLSKGDLRSVDGKSSGFGDGSNSTSDSESVDQLPEPRSMGRLKPMKATGYFSDSGRRDLGYASDTSTRSSPLDYVSRHKYAPPAHLLSETRYAGPYPPIREEDGRPTVPSGRPQPPPYGQMDLEHLSEKDLTDSEELYDNILAMQQKLGVDLEESTDSESETKQLPPYVPANGHSENGYMSDASLGRVPYTEREKSQRCAQLLSEFKNSRNVSEELPVAPAKRCQSVLEDVISEEPRLPPALKRSNSTGASSVYREWLV